MVDGRNSNKSTEKLPAHHVISIKFRALARLFKVLPRIPFYAQYESGIRNVGNLGLV